MTKEQIESLVKAAKACVDEWDENEIGQIDGDTIDALRAALAAHDSKHPRSTEAPK